MNTMIKALVVGTAVLAGSALADIGGHSQSGWQDNPAAGWDANIPAFDSIWMAPSGGWDAKLPPAFPVEIGFPGLGDWNVGVEPPRHGGGEYHCMAIGCQRHDDGRNDIITIGDCSKGPC